jgi:hypothetical protein
LRHAAGKSADHLRGAIGQLEFFQQFVSAPAAFFRRDTKVRRVENKDLARRQREIVIGTLWDDSNETLYGGLLLPYVVIADPGTAASRSYPCCENANRGGFAGAVWAEQSEDLSGLHLKRQAIESGNFGLRLLRVLRVGARDETAAGSERRRRGVHFAQIFCAYSNSHE